MTKLGRIDLSQTTWPSSGTDSLKTHRHDGHRGAPSLLLLIEVRRSGIAASLNRAAGFQN